MIRVYCDRPSEGARDLIAAIRRLGVDAGRARTLQRIRRNDFVVNWGSSCGHGLNHGRRRDKYHELQALVRAGIAVPRHTRIPPVGDRYWLGRSAHHQEGRDLLRPVARPDYYVERLDIEREFRLHVFGDQVIRTGKKVPDGDGRTHPWIRSTAAGWKLDYGAEWRNEMQQRYRDAAKAAVRALGYDFGAVDLAVLRSPQRPRPFVVLEVNSAPGLSIEHTADAYARHIVSAARGS